MTVDCSLGDNYLLVTRTSDNSRLEIEHSSLTGQQGCQWSPAQGADVAEKAGKSLVASYVFLNV